MVRSKLKNHFIKKKIDKLSTIVSAKNNATNKKIKKVAIITTENFFRRYDFSEILIQKFQVRNPKIYSFRKFSKNDKKSYKHFSEKDFNWRGEITDSSLKSFLEEPFDLLICFFNKKSIYLNYTVISSNSIFKVGFSDTNLGCFDLDIKCSISQVDLFFDEMKKYLEILQRV